MTKICASETVRVSAQCSRKRRLVFSSPVAMLAAYCLLTWQSSSAEARMLEGPLRFRLQTEPPAVPAFSFMDAAGKEINLQAFRGKVVLLNIWATWCAPCRIEMPSLDRLQEKLGGKDFEVVALSIDKGEKAPSAIRSFYKTANVRRLPIYLDAKGEASSSLRVFGVPATLLIDRKGREIGRLNGVAEWDSPEALAFVRNYIDKR